MLKIRLSAKIRACRAVDRAVKLFPARPDENVCGIVRLDAFGDYLLFRNFLRIFRENPAFSGRKIVLIGNRLWKDFALHYEADCIDQFIEIRRGPFFENPAYRFRKMREIRSAGLGTLICPMHSRGFLYEDAVAGISGAKERITGPGNTDNALEKDRLRGLKFYNKILPTSQDEYLFEYLRNRNFFQALTTENQEDIEMELPARPAGICQKFGLSEQKYAVLFVGAGDIKRCWPAGHFAQIGKFLQDKYGLQIVSAGGPTETSLEDNLAAAADFPLVRTAGKTSLQNLAELIAGCRILVSNETSAVHLAAATGRPAVCPTNNTWHIGRFNPYPAEIAPKISYLFPPEIDARAENFAAVRAAFHAGKKHSPAAVSPERIQAEIERILD